MLGRLRATSATGFTLIELVVATFIIGVAVVGLFGLILLTVRTAAEGERRIAATALANERMELVRNLPYAQVGTEGGVPSGPLLQTETAVRNETTYTVRIDIRYVDDPYDGSLDGEESEDDEQITICHQPPGGGEPQTITVGASALPAHLAHGDTQGPCGGGEGTGEGDTYTADYKQVRVEVSWNSQNQPKPVLLITFVTPDGIEGGEEGGTLDFQALDAAGAGVHPADVRLVNGAVSPPVDFTTETNVEGRVVLPGLPPSSGAYALTVSRDGYTTERTYDTLADFIPDADHGHLTILQGDVTQKTFFIDAVSSLALAFEEGGEEADETECQPHPGQGQGQGQQNKPLKDIAYTMQGTKTIGVDGDGEPVHAVSAAGTSDNQGEASHEDLLWDQYDIQLDPAVDCDIAETSVPLPLALAPGEAAALTLRLVAHTPISLQVAVVDTAGTPLDNATVRLRGFSLDETRVTGEWGQVFFADLPAAGQYALEVSAPGHASFSDTLSLEGTAQTTVQLGAL